MKKFVCLLSVLGILLGGVLFINSLSVPLEANRAEIYGWAVDNPSGGGYRCLASPVHDCWQG